MKRASLLSILFILVFCIWNSLNEERWKGYGVIVWDVACYYGYLQENISGIPDSVAEKEFHFGGMFPATKYLKAPNGNKVFKGSMGMAIMYSPFYAIGYIAHYISHGQGGSGYEVEYRIAMQFFGTFFLLMWMLLMRKLLRRYFNDGVVALTLVIIAMGTNAFYYTTYEGGMSHVVNMFLYLLFILATEKWYAKPSFRNTVAIGLLMGLMTLIRPISIILGIFFVLYGITTLQVLKERFLFLLRKWHLLVLMGVCALVVWIPQMIYWYRLTGQLFYYSYVGESFYFLKPNIYLGMIGWRKGWLIYTPVGIFMLLGFIWMRRYVKDLFIASLIFYVSFVWVIFSWWCWWYGGAFSCRPMVDSYSILALPLAAFLQYVFLEKRNRILSVSLSVLLLLLVSLNLFQTWQYKKTIIHWDSMTYKAYKATFLNTQHVPDSLMQGPPWDEAYAGKYAE